MWKHLIQSLALPESEDGAPAGWWTARLGLAQAAWGRNFLPSNELADSIPCPISPNRSCRQLVDRSSSGAYYASCEHVPSHCTPVELKRESLVLFRPSLPNLCGLLRGVFGLGEPLYPGQSRGPLRIGDAHLRPDLRIPVYLLFGRRCENPAWFLQFIDPAVNTVMLVPSAAVVSRLPSHGRTQVFNLGDMLESDPRNRLVLSNPGQSAWAKWKNEICPPAKDGILLFPTPSDASWTHVTLSMGADDHTLSVYVRTPSEERSGSYHMSKLMMMKPGGKPKDSWHLLTKFIKEGGWHHSKGIKYQEKMKMPIKRLRDELKTIFAIGGMPIRWDKLDNAWVANFQVRSDRP